MKKSIIILLLIVASGMSALAQSMMKVSTADKQVINVALNGRYFKMRGTSVTVGDLPPGRHSLRIYGVVRKKNGKLREAVIYEGPVQTRSGMISLFVYDPATRGINIQEQDLDEYRKNNVMPPGAPVNDNTQGGNYDNAANDDTNAPVATPVTIAEPSTLTPDKTSDLKKQVDAKKTDTDKMKVLKESLKNEKITTEQAGTISDLLNFESTKLEFLKWAFTLVVDADNYETLSTRFTYKQYQDEFIKFLEDGGK